MASNKRVDLMQIENFVRRKSYSEDISKNKGEKANFKTSCKNFKVFDWYLTYKGKGRVIFDNDRKRIITHYLNEGLGEDAKIKALAVHRGRESTYQKIAGRFYWHGIVEDVKEYIKNFRNCQQQGKILK